jgi:ABC-2 type transport system ATP-binding protein
MAQISLQHVTVDLPIYGAHNMNLKSRALRSFRRQREEIPSVRALEDISVNAENGQRIGLVGPNGAGKTTLLRVLARALEPTSGRAMINGSVVSLLGGDLGLEPQFSGFENIIRRGIYLNQKAALMKEKAAEISEFTGLGQRINDPLYTYSNGMRARLSFTIATSLSPEILIIDEGIGTADREFNERAAARFESLLGRTGILVIASHDPQVLKQYEPTAVWELASGRLVG